MQTTAPFTSSTPKWNGDKAPITGSLCPDTLRCKPSPGTSSAFVASRSIRFDSTAEENLALTTVIVGFARFAFEDFMVPAELVARRALPAHRAIYKEACS